MRAFIFAASLILVAVLAACQGSDLTSPTSRGLDPAGKKVGIGSGKGAKPTSLDLGGVFWTSSPQPGGAKTNGRWASFETPFLAPIPIGLNVDTDGGGLGANQLPMSDQIDWNHCIWNADIASPYNPAVVPPFAMELWDTFMTSQAAEIPRLFFILVDTKASGAADWDHTALTRWFTTAGPDKYMWELEVGAEPNLSLVQPVATWDGTAFSFSQGIIRVTRTFCGSASGPAGCVPARGKGNRPTVVCRNDGLAFPGVTFTATFE